MTLLIKVDPEQHMNRWYLVLVAQQELGRRHCWIRRP
jgi:hypothetical protein